MNPRNRRLVFLLSFLVGLAAVGYPATAGEDRDFWTGAQYDPAVPTMDAVLGHAPGERIVSHAEIMTYLRALEAAQPERIKVVEYARSWEGRELVNVFIGSEQNIARMDEISDGMKRLADPRKTSEAEARRLIDSLPAITWLAYGVHGNEISSPDASLLTAYHLLASRGDEVVDVILASSLVVLDPTQNPDGRDRFVHNFRIAEGLVPQAHLLAAEHNEPWPGGRTNHYYFDLNRDWLALTQPETRGRVRALQEWFPAIFVDLHEMGGNSTYYFSPEARPYSPHITSRQRANLELYGRNNAKWFDRFGFDYFTREVYDAFYPGYGGSWPLYHGSIATTYEQASARGLVWRRADSIDLPFRETVRHHFVSSISTAETTARHRSELLSDFYRYRVSAIEEGRSEAIREYILPNRGDRSTVLKLASLMAEHGVDVRRSNSTVRACGKEYPEGSYAISMAQPTKRLIRMLLDPEVPMEADFIEEQERRRRRRERDEIYDVTGWSLPLMFNVECVPCGEEAQGDFENVKPPRILSGKLEGGKATVAYLAPWATAAAARLLSAALREGLRVFSTDKPFTQNGRRFPSGTLIFKVSQNPANLHDTLVSFASSTGAKIHSTDTGWVEEGVNFGSRNVVHVRRPRVALAWDRPTRAYSAGATRFVLERQFDYPVTPIRSRQLVGADLSSFDVLILPDGNYDSAFRSASAERLEAWVRAGGTLIGLAGAVEYLADEDVGLLNIRREGKAGKSDAEKDKQNNSKQDNSNGNTEGSLLASESDFLEAIEPKSEQPDSVPGVLVRARLDPNSWVTAGLEGSVNALVNGRRIFSPITLDHGVNAATFAGADELVASGYMWEENRRQLAYKPFVVVEKHGRGIVVGFTTDPTFRAYLDGLNVLFLNAVFRAPARARPAVAP